MDSDDEQHVIEIYLRIKPTANPTKKLEYDVAAGKVEFHVPRDATGGLINNTRENYEFTFNGVFPPDCSQEAVFNKVCRRAVLGCLDGYNGTVFAYGQTGSGKTFTVSGGTARYADRGLVPRALELLFSELAARTASGLLAPSGSAVRVSYLEIYNEQCYDLLGGDSSPPSLDVGQGTRGGYDSLPRVGLYEDEGGGLVLRGLGQHPAESGEEALQLLFRGESARAVAETAMNASSSRSHAAFCVHVETRPADGRDAVRRAKLYIVDLAGSERVAKTGTEGTSLAVESRHINLSLSYLEQVIVALQERAAGLERPHVPYRNSCLTSVLRDSLGGNCRTAMVATVAALAGSVEEGVATCRFAQRVAMISNAARVNEDTDAPALIARLRAELRDARAELRLARGLAAEEAGGGGGDPGGGGAAAGAPQPPAPQLSAEELARVADAAAAYVAAAGDAAAAGGGPPQPPQPPAFGGSLPRLRALLAALRAIARGEAPAGADGGAGGGGAGGGGGDAAAGPPVGGAAPGPAAAQAGRGATPPAPPGPELAQRDAELRALLSLLHGAALQPAAAAGEGGGGDGEAEAAAAAAAAAAASSEPPPLSLRCAHLLLAGAPAPAPPGGAAAAAGLGPGGCGCGGGDAAHALARRVAAFAAFRRSARRAAALRLRLSADLSAASAEAAGCAAAANAARGRIAAAAADAARRAAQAAAAAASGDAAWAASATAAAAAAADEGAAARGAYGEAASGLAAARGRAADARRALGDAAARAQADLDAWLAAAGWPGPGWAAAPAPAGDAAVVAGEEGDGVDGEGVAGAGAAGAGAAGAAADDGAARAGAGWGGWPAAAAAAAGQPPAWPPAQAAAPAAPQPPRAASVLLLAALGLGPSPGGGGPDAEPPLPPPPPPPPAAASAPLCGDAQADDDIRAFFAARERLAAAAR